MGPVEFLLFAIFILPVILIIIGIIRSRKNHTVSYVLLLGLLIAIPMIVYFIWTVFISLIYR